MSEGVAIDMGSPNAIPVNSNGEVVAPRVLITLEADRAGAARFAIGFSRMGMQDIANRICQTAGITVPKANIIERHPAVAGFVTGLASVGIAYGGYRLIRYVRNRNAMPQVTAAGKVMPIRAPAKS